MHYYHYRSAGLTISSQLALPEFGAVQHPTSHPDVLIQEGKVSCAGTEPAPPGTYSWRSASDQFLFEVAEVARFQVKGGSQIIFERLSTDDVLLKLYLLGSVIGALWHQRGRLPLHAGGVVIDNLAWAFVGNSGAGKSSLVAALSEVAGAGYLSDDVCIIDVPNNRSPVAWPGLARLRASPELCAALRLEDPLFVGAQDPFGKHAMMAPWEQPLSAIPLAGVIVLEATATPATPAMEQLTAAASLSAILEHTYRPEYLATEGQELHFQQCAALTRQIRVYRLRRSWDLSRLPTEAIDIAHLLRVRAT